MVEADKPILPSWRDGAAKRAIIDFVARVTTVGHPDFLDARPDIDAAPVIGEPGLGTGIRHSEFNASKTDPVHFLQIWIIPEQKGIAPGYEQKAFPDAEKRGRLRLIGSCDGRDGSVTIDQDVDLYTTLLGEGDAVEHTIAPGRGGWVQVARGSVGLNSEAVREGDGVGISTSGKLRIAGFGEAEVPLFDMGA